MRLYCGSDLATFNRDLYDYAARCASWDFSTEVVNLDEQGNVARTAPMRDFGKDYIGNIGWVGSDDELNVYSFFLENLFRNKDHILSEKEERLLASIMTDSKLQRLQCRLQRLSSRRNKWAV